MRARTDLKTIRNFEEFLQVLEEMGIFTWNLNAKYISMKEDAYQAKQWFGRPDKLVDYRVYEARVASYKSFLFGVIDTYKTLGVITEEEYDSLEEDLIETGRTVSG